MKFLNKLLAFLKTIPLTFYSAPFYRDLAENGKGIGIGFVLFITLLQTAWIAPTFLSGIEQVVTEQGELLELLPEMEIKNGVLSIQGEPKQNFSVLKDDENGPFHIIFDMEAPTIAPSQIEPRMKDEKIILWINKEGFFVYNFEQGATDYQDMGGYEDMVITHDDWLKMSDMLASFASPSLFAGYAFLLGASHLLFIFMGGLFLWAIASLFKRKTDFQASARLTAATKVPLAFLGLVITPIPLFQTLFWFGFAMFALLALPPKRN